MKVFHLTTSETAEKILADGNVTLGSFCGNAFKAFFASKSQHFDFVEIDVILGSQKDATVLELIFPDDIIWYDDPDAEYYGPWIYTKFEEVLPFTSGKIVEKSSWWLEEPSWM